MSRKRKAALSILFRSVFALVIVPVSMVALATNVVGGEDTPPSPSTKAAEPSHSPDSKSPVPEGSHEVLKETSNETSHEASHAAVDPTKTVAPETACLASEAAIDDLKKAREQIEIKQKELTAREAELVSREQALTEEMKKLSVTRDLITKTQDEKKKDRDEKVAKLIETLLTMSPKAAAKILTSIEDTVAVSVFSEMDTTHLAKIAGLMDPLRVSKLSENLVGVVRTKMGFAQSSKSRDLAAATPKKGGETNNDRHDEQHKNDEAQSNSAGTKIGSGIPALPAGSEQFGTNGQAGSPGSEKPGITQGSAEKGPKSN